MIEFLKYLWRSARPYLWYIIRHKWFVGIECFKMGLYWQGIVHDMSKLSAVEFGPYARQFYGGKPAKDKNGKIISSPEFDRAWNHHQKVNPHHWQYWLLHEDQPATHWWVEAMHRMNGPWVLVEKTGDTQSSVAYLDDTFIVGHDVKNHYQSGAYAEIIAETMNARPKALQMPEKYAKEMLADWRGTGRTIGKPDTRAWYMTNRDHILLHPETRRWVENQLLIPYESRVRYRA